MLFLGGGDVLGLYVFSFPTATFGSPFREKSAQGEVFFWWDAVALIEGVVGGRSLCQVGCWDIREVLEERVDVESMKPTLSGWTSV